MRGETVHPKIFKNSLESLSLHHTLEPQFFVDANTHTQDDDDETTTKGEKGKTLG